MYMYTYLQLHKGETCLARPSFKNFVKRQSKVQTFPSINLFLRHYLDILCMIFYWMQYITLFGTVAFLLAIIILRLLQESVPKVSPASG